MSDPFRPLLEAVSFAARAHRHQTRKDGVTPYVSHAIRVCLVVRCVFGIDDAEVLAAAVLHDTIEDTTTDYDDIAGHFGQRVAGWVAQLSKDKRVEEAERETRYAAEVVGAAWQVQLIKLADIYDNLNDAATAAVAVRTRQRSRYYLDHLARCLAPECRAAYAIVNELAARTDAPTG